MVGCDQKMEQISCYTGFSNYIVHRYDSCNYVRFGSKLYCIIDMIRVIMLGLVSNYIVS